MSEFFEGPYMDSEGRECLGIWANEGNTLLVLRRESHDVSFHIAISGVGIEQATIERFRLERIRKFLEAENG